MVTDYRYLLIVVIIELFLIHNNHNINLLLTHIIIKLQKTNNCPAIILSSRTSKI